MQSYGQPALVKLLNNARARSQRRISTVPTIIGLCGSLRRASFNLMLLQLRLKPRLLEHPSSSSPFVRSLSTMAMSKPNTVSGGVVAGAAYVGDATVVRSPRADLGRKKMFDTNGRVVDTATQDRIRTFVEGFAAFVGRAAAAGSLTVVRRVRTRSTTWNLRAFIT